MKHFKTNGLQIVRGAEVLVGMTMTMFFLCNIGMRYVNIGSLTGVLVFGVLLIHGLKPERFASIGQKLSQSPSGRIVRKLIRTLRLVILILAVLTTGFMTAGIPERPDSEDRTIIILGSGVNEDGTPTYVTQSRTDAAMEYIKDHPDSPIIASGGLYTSDRITEAESIKQYLIHQGIDAKRIYVETESTSTAENLRFTTVLLQKERLPKAVVISTSEFHSYRAGLFATRNQLDHRAITAKTPWYILPTCWMREMYGILDAWIIHRR